MASKTMMLKRSHQQISVSGLSAPVEVRRHPTARRLTLRVSRTRRAVIVTMPMRCNISEADTFLAHNIEWVRERLDTLPQPIPFQDDAEIPLRGSPHIVCFIGPKRTSEVVRVEQADCGATHLCVAGRPEHAARRLQDWLIAQARSDIDERVAWHARNLRLRPRRICVRDQTTRWGSCSSNGVLSFSWRLILAPSNVLDYVAAHEVAHLAEMNHGQRFWDLVQMTMPRMDEGRDWLHNYGTDLHCYGSQA
jgi:predicted metal-dependent hydrolase